MSFGANKTGSLTLDGGHTSVKSGLGSTIKDPRPITTKQWQEKAVKNVAQYLVDSGYSHGISAASLKQLRQADFYNIIKFLCSEIDPDFPIGQNKMKIEDEFAGFMKAIGYPYPLLASTLKSITSPTCFPVVLGALAWLTECLSYLNSFGLTLHTARHYGFVGPSDDNSVDFEADPSLCPAPIRKFLISGFRNMNNKSARVADEEKQIRDVFQRQHDYYTGLCESADDELQRIQNMIREMDREGDEDQELQRRIKVLIQEEQKEAANLSVVESKKTTDNLQMQLSALDKEVKELETMKARLTSDLDVVVDQVRRQECSLDDFEALKRDVDRLVVQTREHSSSLSNMAEDKSKVSTTLHQKIQDLQSAMLASIMKERTLATNLAEAGLTSAVSGEHKVLTDARFNIEEDMAVLLEQAMACLDVTEEDEKSRMHNAVNMILGFNWRGEVKPAIMDLNLKLGTKLKIAKVAASDGADERSRVLRSIDAKNDEILYAKKSLESLEGQKSRREDELKERLKQMENETNMLRSQLANFEADAEDGLRKARDALKSAKEKESTELRLWAEKEREAQEVLSRSEQHVQQFKNKTRSSLQAAAQQSSLQVVKIDGELRQCVENVRNRSHETIKATQSLS